MPITWSMVTGHNTASELRSIDLRCGQVSVTHLVQGDRKALHFVADLAEGKRLISFAVRGVRPEQDLVPVPGVTGRISHFISAQWCFDVYGFSAMNKYSKDGRFADSVDELHEKVTALGCPYLERCDARLGGK